jgi:hypothetical protein
MEVPAPDGDVAEKKTYMNRKEWGNLLHTPWLIILLIILSK